MRIEPFGQSLGRIADPREPGVETVEAGREGVLHDLAGDLLGSEVECVGEHAVKVLRDLKWRGQPLDEKVLSLGRDDAVRGDAVLETCLERTAQPVEPPDHQCIAGAKMRERVSQARTVGGTAFGIFENLLAPSRLKRITLEIERLVVRGAMSGKGWKTASTIP